MENINGKKVFKLAFSGPMGSGKTSAARLSLALMADKFSNENAIGYIIKFAQPLYQSMLSFHRFKDGAPARTFLQRLGDLARREFGDNVFESVFADNIVGLITNKLPELAQENILIMSDDVRFLGEYKTAKNFGFTVVGLDAPEEIRKARAGDSFVNIHHRSEIELSLFTPDYTIQNDEDETALEFKLKKLFDETGFFEG